MRSLLCWHLQQAGYRVQQASDISRAKEIFQATQPDLVIMETALADGDGLDFCDWLQSRGRPLVLILSARTTEPDVVAGLRAGADDYLKKPFGMQEFLARVEALTRRNRRATAPASLSYGDLNIDLIQRRVRYKGEYIDLTPQEFSLLYVLAQAEGSPLSRADLLRRAWPDAIDNPRTVDTHVLSLRKKIEVDPRQPNMIQTVRNVGYRLNVDPVEAVNAVRNGGHSFSHNRVVNPAMVP